MGWNMIDEAEPQAVTALLQDLTHGDKDALNRIVSLLYKELRRIADGYLRREHQPTTLQPTALVNEAYVRLVGQDQPDYRNRSHFLGIAARVMRQVLVDHARARVAHKRGTGIEKLPLDEARDACVEKPAVMIRLDDALRALEQHDERKAKLVEMRFFGGLTAEESAALLKLPVATVRRELRIAHAWLQRQLDRN